MARTIEAATAVAVIEKNAVVDEAKVFTLVYGPRDEELVHIGETQSCAEYLAYYARINQAIQTANALLNG